MPGDPDGADIDEIDEWFRTVEGAIVSEPIDAYNEQDDNDSDVAAVLGGLSCMGADIHNGLLACDDPGRYVFHGLLDVAGDDVPPQPPGTVTVNFLLDQVCE